MDDPQGVPGVSMDMLSDICEFFGFATGQRIFANLGLVKKLTKANLTLLDLN